MAEQIQDVMRMADQFIDAGATQPKFIEVPEMENLESETRLDATQDIGEPFYTLTREGIGLFPKGDIQAIKAPQKNGKTFLISMIQGVYMRGEYNGLKSELTAPRIIYIDTEQHPRNTAKVYRRSCNIAGINEWENRDDFKVFHLRGKTPDLIRRFCSYVIRKYRPDVCFIDGVVDLAFDFNDLKESVGLVTELMDLSRQYDCAIPCVLHVNPGSDKMRGHLGTILAQKASDVLCCLKDKDKASGEVTFTVEQTDARNRDIRQFAFVIEDHEMVNGKFIAIPVAPHISVKERTESNDIMAQALVEPLRHSDLVQKIMEIENIKDRAAAYRIKTAIDSGIIEKDPVFGKYRYIGLDLKNEKGLPF